MCADCSNHSRKLSKKDPKFYRVCSKCDKRLEYIKIEHLFIQVEKFQSNLLKDYEKQIEIMRKKKIKEERKINRLNKEVHPFNNR